MRRAWSILFLAILVPSAALAGWDPLQSARRAASEGQRALAAGDTTGAIRELMRAQALAPEDPEIRMGLGEVLYEATEFENARRQYESIASGTGPVWDDEALYNAGNAAFVAGDLQKALDLYTGAVLAAEDAPPADLLHNLELTQRLLEQQQEQQQQQQQSEGEEQSEQQQSEGDPSRDQEQSGEQQQEQQRDEQEQAGDEQQGEEEQQAQAKEDEGEEEPAPAEEMQQENLAEMTPEEAMRLLQALDADEEELRKSIQRRLRGEEKETEHDW